MTTEISTSATENYQLRRSSASSNIARPKLTKANTTDSHQQVQAASKSRKKNKLKVSCEQVKSDPSEKQFESSLSELLHASCWI